MQTNPAIVLVIEKHPIMREALCTAIANESDLMVATPSINGLETVKMLRTLKPDIILFALGNNGQNGLEALKLLRKFLPVIPILALTTDEVAEQEQAALQAGVDRVLTKSAPRAELIQTLHEMWAQAMMHPSESNLEKEDGER